MAKVKPVIEIDMTQGKGNQTGCVTIGPILYQQIVERARDLGVPNARLVKTLIMYGLRELDLKVKRGAPNGK